MWPELQYRYYYEHSPEQLMTAFIVAAASVTASSIAWPDPDVFKPEHYSHGLSTPSLHITASVDSTSWLYEVPGRMLMHARRRLLHPRAAQPPTQTIEAVEANPVAKRAALLVYDVFTPGENGIKAFRIPGILAVPLSPSSTALLAYAEGRVEGCGDFDGTHTIVLKRSVDGGRTWGKLQTLLDPSELLGAHLCPRVKHAGCEFWDPTAVYDAEAGQVHLLTALSTSANGRMTGRMSLYVMSSLDGGVSWGAPRNITSSVVGPYDDDTSIITPGNGHATQLASGRLLVAGYRRPAGDASEHCSTIASDDHGRTWFLQPAHGMTGNGTSECEVVEVGEASVRRVYMDERVNGEEQQRRGGCGGGIRSCRWHTESADGGKTWTAPTPAPMLVDPSNAAGIAKWHTRSSVALLFSNTASQSARANITLRVSFDAGKTWPWSELVSGPGGYSDVQLLPGSDGASDHAAVLYEKDTCKGIAVGIVELPADVA